MKKSTHKRLTAWLLTLALVVTLLPGMGMTALAVEDGETTACRIDFAFAGNNSRATAKGTVQVRNVCDLTFSTTVSVRTTSEKPLAAPPACTTVIALPTAGQIIA